MENDHWIADLEACGWFSDLDAAEVLPLKHKLACGDRATNYLHLASFVIDRPELFGGGGSLMESESDNAIDSYEDLLRAYANTSDGQFTPEAIIEENNEEEDHFAIGFLSKGRIYALFAPGSPRFDIEINDLVNESLANEGIEKRYFVLPTTDDRVAFAFIAPSVYERACQLGIIPLQEDLFSELYGDALGSAESAAHDHGSEFSPEADLATA